jgi:hypothetical protein
MWVERGNGVDDVGVLPRYVLDATEVFVSRLVVVVVLLCNLQGRQRWKDEAGVVASACKCWLRRASSRAAVRQESAA